MKSQIISEIISKLTSLGINASKGNDTDIIIDTEFLDASWSTGKKKITYESNIYVNEEENVIYMYEKTTEVGHGLSFGGDSGSSFQSGKTLFRKVKSVQYGLDGKAYEYTLDLGSIPKSIKEIAQKYGWKFKTVINKNKAQYPAGYVPNRTTASFEEPIQNVEPKKSGYCNNCGMPLIESAKFCDKCGMPIAPAPSQQQGSQIYNQPSQPSYANPQSNFHAKTEKPPKKKGGGIIGILLLILIATIVFFTLYSARAGLLSWAGSIIVVITSLVLQIKLIHKGLIITLLLVFLTVFILLYILGSTL